MEIKLEKRKKKNYWEKVEMNDNKIFVEIKPEK